MPQYPDAQAVLTKTAEEVGTSIDKVEADEGEASSLPFWLSPRHQQHNAAMAMAMMESLAAGGHLPHAAEAWRTARDTTLWPARFEVLKPAPLLDGQRLVRVPACTSYRLGFWNCG